MGIDGRVSASALLRAVAAYPKWLGAEYVAWVRGQEARGQRFTSAQAAIRCAREEA